MNVLDQLEQKIRSTKRDLDALREENRRLGEQLDAAARPSGGAPEVSRLQGELRLLHEERTTVRERVEQLIALLEEAP